MGRKDKPPRLPAEFPLPPEHSLLPPELSHSSAASARPKQPAAPETAPLGDEFSSGGGCAKRRADSRRILYMAAALALIASLTGLPAVGGLPSTNKPTEPATVESVPEPSSQMPDEPAPSSQMPDDTEQPEPCRLYLTYISGSYCMVDAELTEPETISAASLTLTDYISGTLFYTVDISRSEINTGHYTAVFDRNPEDIRQYWAAHGEGTFPSFDAALTVERRGGEREEYTQRVTGNVIENISRSYSPDERTLTVSIFDKVKYTAVFSALDDIDEQTVRFTVSVDGKPLPPQAYSAAYTSEQQERYGVDGTPIGVVTTYIAGLTAQLPDSITADTEITFTLDISYAGHLYTYTERIP